MTTEPPAARPPSSERTLSASPPPPRPTDEVLVASPTSTAVDDWMASHPVFASKARGIRVRALRFTASWFSVTMGTGIVNTLLFDLPFASAHAAFRAIGSAWLILDIILFIAFTFLTLARYYLYPKIFWAMIRHETHSLFLGTIPMGFVTIVSGIAATGHEYGLNTLNTALVLYWIIVAMSLLCAFGVPYFMFTSHRRQMPEITAALLLPVVPLITNASVSATICKLLLEQTPPRTTYCLTMLVGGYLQGGIGALLAAMIVTLYIQRLILHHLPPRDVITSAFLPVGPIGQFGYATIELGRVSCQLFPLISTSSHAPELALLGPPLLGTAIFVGLLLWGLGIWFMFFAIASIVTQMVRHHNPEEEKLALFNMGWWAWTFPIGSLTLLTFSLATVFDSSFFRICSAILTFSVLLLWTAVFIPTAIGFFRGTLFAAPCLQSLPKEYVERMRPKVTGAEEREGKEGNGGREGEE
ncbi:hypothetical protein JCM8547_005533 [Rhodosporidiobolus lusitaniae]